MLYVSINKATKMQEIIEAPIPGKILVVNITAGNTIQESGAVCIIEAMKMENPIMSPVKDSVKAILVLPSTIVKTDDKSAVI